MSLQADPREFVHRIDHEGRIRYVNEAWLAFAAENGWTTFASQVIGSQLIQQIADPETRHVYQLLIDRAWDGGRQAYFRYRCDSPNCRRFMEMRINRSAPDQVEFRSRVLHMEMRDPVGLLDPGLVRRSTEVLKVCSWCKSVWANTSWVEVEQAVDRLGLLSAPVLPQISHGICPTCSERMTSVRERL